MYQRYNLICSYHCFPLLFLDVPGIKIELVNSGTRIIFYHSVTLSRLKILINITLFFVTVKTRFGFELVRLKGLGCLKKWQNAEIIRMTGPFRLGLWAVSVVGLYSVQLLRVLVSLDYYFSWAVIYSVNNIVNQGLLSIMGQI